jgi:CubicO group peptidase (beta-lactamase class C family)
MRETSGYLAATVIAASLITTSITAFAGDRPSDSPTIVLPSDADIQKILAERADALAGPNDGIGIVVGIVGPQGRRVISYGHMNQGDPRPLNRDTVFEIGSVSKVFTALLLADMVQKNEVALTDPVAKYLPGIKLPEHDGHSITLLDLATHTSGLPFMPDILPVIDLSGASAAEHSDAEIYQFLNRYQLKRNPGAEWDYSNIGYWLLGQALAARAGTTYENLLQTRVIGPLKMSNTAVTPSSRMKEKLAIGHNAILQPAAPFSAVSIYRDMAAAGGIVSSTNDMLTFLSACLGYEHSPLSTALASMLAARRPIDKESDQALGWVIVRKADGTGHGELIMHEGFTWGYASSVVWDPKSRVGVVVLSNQQSGVTDIARHLLRPDAPLEHPVVTKHAEIKLDPAIFASNFATYAGDYAVEDEGVVRIGRDHLRDGNGEVLTIQLPIGWGLPKFQLHPESPRDFFVAELPIRVTFQADAEGRTKGLLLYPPRSQCALPGIKITAPGNTRWQR